MDRLKTNFLQGLFLVNAALAQVGGEDLLIKNPLKFGTIAAILAEVAKFVFNIGLALVTVMVLFAGFQLLTAAGRPEQIDKGKRTLTWAIIGTVVILIAGGIAELIANILGGKR